MKTENPCEFCDGANLSNCCGAEIIGTDICNDCREHCSDMCEDCEENN